MQFLSVLLGGGDAPLIANGDAASAGTSVPAGHFAPPVMNGTQIATAAWVAATLQTVITRAGAGVLRGFFFRSSQINLQLRTKITIDGVVVYDKLSAIAGAYIAQLPVGGLSLLNDGGGGVVIFVFTDFNPLRYKSSILVECSTSASVAAIVATVDAHHELTS